MFQLVDAEKAHYPVTVLCEVLEVSRSGYYDWKKRPCCERSKADAQGIRVRNSPRVDHLASDWSHNCGRHLTPRRLAREGGVPVPQYVRRALAERISDGILAEVTDAGG